MVARPGTPPGASWAADHPPMPQRAPAPEPPPVQDWVAFTPPAQPAPQPTAVWELPPGFVPMRAPRGARRLRLVGAVVAVALLAALGWFGYLAVSHNHKAATTLAHAGPVAAVSYTSSDGHFRVGLAEQPHILTQTTAFGGYSFKVTIAADPLGGVAAGGVTVTPDAPAGAMTSMLRGFVAGLQRDGSVSDIAMSTYQGRPSVSATLTKSTGTQVVLAYASSPSRMYMLIAADRASLAALEGRFHPTP
jgi:hypothetical protein